MSVNHKVELKKTFEEKATEVLQGLNELETILGQLRSDLGGAGILGQRKIAEAREAVQKAQNVFSTTMVNKI